MHIQSMSLSVKTLAEVALTTSRIGRNMIEDGVEIPPSSVRLFWQETRSLVVHWQRQLDLWSPEDDAEMNLLTNLATELFLTELVARVWSTVFLGLDRKSGREDLTRIARNAVGGLMQIRHSVLSRMLQLPESQNRVVAELERLRRRSDRWTDLLIGNISGRRDLLEFAFDAERARDFSDESADFNPATGPNPVEHLVTAGLRMAFMGQLSEQPLVHSSFEQLIQSIIGTFPSNSFHRDGSVKSVLERRLSATALRDEPIPSSLLDGLMSNTNASAEAYDALPDVGISFKNLRHRPK